MRRFLLAALGMLVVGPASAGVLFPRMDTREIAVDVVETKTMGISSTTYTSILDATVFTSTVNIWAIEVYVPKSMTQTINCSFSVGVSTSVTNTDYANFGREISPSNGVLWQANYGAAKNMLYCKSPGQEAAGSKTKVTVTLFR